MPSNISVPADILAESKQGAPPGVDPPRATTPRTPEPKTKLITAVIRLLIPHPPICLRIFVLCDRHAMRRNFVPAGVELWPEGHQHCQFGPLSPRAIIPSWIQNWSIQLFAPRARTLIIRLNHDSKRTDLQPQRQA